MHDYIFIKDLTINTIIGILPDERINAQPVVLNIKCFFDFREAAQSDNFEHTIDYADIVAKLKQFVEQSRFNLVEKLAEQVCQFLFDRYAIENIQLRLTKPNALNDAIIGVNIERQRDSTSKARCGFTSTL